MKAYVEHANLTVENIDNTIRFLETAIPEFAVRHRGFNSKHWCHIGSEDSYLALQEREPKDQPYQQRTPYYDIGVNHIGLVVGDVGQVRQRLLAAGYQENPMSASEAFRKRIYFYDTDGIEWEFIEYLSEKPSERNHYE
ncbi:VOC family protein [Vibrio proteolyticus]|uniref:Glyoxalase-family protein n=1 Tax=Vibrio proteolyticus NBRC 13287 TaxID=1219065 RepID=U3A2T9_VIBPR|nr:VOC family protein [Vibrio proteolyticus]GAD68000.1 glyoxalase-family protein [Vibrio proteolyticus NBRC 13287]